MAAHCRRLGDVAHGEHLQRQMACTRAEFISWVPGATRHAPMHISGNTLTLSIGGGIVEITLEEAVPRRAGPLSLPVLEISMRFEGIDKPTRDGFLDYFDLYTRRGGG
jgi:hypothetical protein